MHYKNAHKWKEKLSPWLSISGTFSNIWCCRFSVRAFPSHAHRAVSQLTPSKSSHGSGLLQPPLNLGLHFILSFPGSWKIFPTFRISNSLEKNDLIQLLLGNRDITQTSTASLCVASLGRHTCSGPHKPRKLTLEATKWKRIKSFKIWLDRQESLNQAVLHRMRCEQGRF